jgi:hypothetical protein
MRIQFERAGGFAGIRLKTDVNTEQLPPEEAKSLEELVEKAQLNEARQAPRRGGAMRDTFEYWFTIEDKGKQYSVRLTDETLPPSAKPLIVQLLALARKPKSSA